MPPRIQYLSFAEGRPLTASLKKGVDAILGAVNMGHTGDYGIGPAADRPAVTRQIRAFAADYGTCAIGDTLGGNGETRARVRLTCERGHADLSITASKDGPVETVAFRGADPCVP
jgi:hypothetical protein